MAWLAVDKDGNRKEAAELLSIIKAFSEGKTIEQRCAESWVEVDEDCDFHFPANSSDARSLEDVCQMCCETFDKAKEILNK